jgi:hypothetical protein
VREGKPAIIKSCVQEELSVFGTLIAARAYPNTWLDIQLKYTGVRHDVHHGHL